VMMAFDVEANGNVTNIKVRKGVRKDLNEEALRLTRLMAAQGKWKPATLKGKAVKVNYTLPFNFTAPK
jgi:TonB family protein